jgi:hypothetical protein
MSKTSWIALFVLPLCLGLCACQKLDQPAPVAGTFQHEQIEIADAIPLEYGRFVGATTDSSNPYWAILWFAKPDETIVAVRVNVSRGQMMRDVLTIPRK